MKRLRWVLLLVVAVSGLGCAGRINGVMKSWEDHHYSELIMTWGPPQAVYDDGMGGRILVYMYNRQWTTPGSVRTTTTGSATIYDNFIWGEAQSYSTYRPPQTYGYTAWRVFRINSSGYIYGWAWRGL